MSPPTVRPYLWMLCGSFWFTLMGLFAHALRDRCDWQLVAVSRSGLATAFALAAARATGARLVFARPAVLWVRSVAGSTSLLLTFYALTHMAVSDVLTITNTFPVWVAVLSWPLAGHRPTAGVWAAAGCAVAGVAVALQGDRLVGWAPPAGGPPADPLAAWAAFAASGFTAVAMLGLNRLAGVSALGVVVHFSAVATAMCGLAWAAFPRPLGAARAADPGAVGLLLGVGLTATAGQVFLTRAFRGGKAAPVAVVGLSQVVMALAADAAVWGKPVGPAALAGTALVLGPTAWVMTRGRGGPAG